MADFVFGAKLKGWKTPSGVKSEYTDRRTAAQIAADKRQAKVSDNAYARSISNPMSAHGMTTKEVARRAKARSERDARYSANYGSAYQTAMRARYPDWEAARQRAAQNKAKMIAKKEAEKAKIRAARAKAEATRDRVSMIKAMAASAKARRG